MGKYLCISGVISVDVPWKSVWESWGWTGCGLTVLLLVLSGRGRFAGGRVRAWSADTTDQNSCAVVLKHLYHRVLTMTVAPTEKSPVWNMWIMCWCLYCLLVDDGITVHHSGFVSMTSPSDSQRRPWTFGSARMVLIGVTKVLVQLAMDSSSEAGTSVEENKLVDFTMGRRVWVAFYVWRDGKSFSEH